MVLRTSIFDNTSICSCWQEFSVRTADHDARLLVANVDVPSSGKCSGTIGQLAVFLARLRTSSQPSSPSLCICTPMASMHYAHVGIMWASHSLQWRRDACHASALPASVRRWSGSNRQLFSWGIRGWGYAKELLKMSSSLSSSSSSLLCFLPFSSKFSCLCSRAAWGIPFPPYTSLILNS